MAETPSAALERLGVTLPTAPEPLAAYVPGVLSSGSPATLLVSGQLPTVNGTLIAEGLVPPDVDFDTAVTCARQSAINALAVAHSVLGSVDRISRVLRLGGFVACPHEFHDHPKVIIGASLFIGEVFGENGKHARAAVGAPSLPINAPVEIEFLFEVKD